MKDTTVAYLAGLIDGEGYIGIKKARAKNSVSTLYHERIQVRMVTEGSIKYLSRQLGGGYYCEKASAVKGRPLFCWQASDALAASILTQLLPYLIVKRASAKTVLNLRRSKNDPRARRRGSPARRIMNSAVLAYRERLYLRCKALNRVGV
jgi:hypothetical protein